MTWRELGKKFKFDHMHNPESVQENETHTITGIWRYKRIIKFLPDDQTFWESAKKKKERKKKASCRIVLSAVQVDSSVKLKEREEKLCNLNVTVIQSPKDSQLWLENLEIKRQMEIIQTTALLRSARILRRVLETWENMLSLKFQWKTIR